MLRPDDTPPMKFPEDLSLAGVPGRWYVAHTKARREKALARRLAAADRPYFLPLTERVTVIRRRRFTSLVPLFGGYVFFVGDTSTRGQVLRTNHAAGILDVADQNQLIADLSRIEHALAHGAGLDPFPFLRKGSRCRVRCGPFAGLEGIVVRRPKATYLVLQVEMLGQAATLEIEPSLLEPAA